MATEAEITARYAAMVDALSSTEIDTPIGQELLELGSGGLESILDFARRPFQAVGHGLGGIADLFAGRDAGPAFRQAFEQFDPFNLITPDTPAESITGGDILGRFGVEEGPQLGPLGSLRSVAGFFAELPLDPLTWLTGPIGKGMSLLGRKTGRPLTSALEGLAGVEGTLGRSTKAHAFGKRLTELGATARAAGGAVLGGLTAGIGEAIEGDVDLSEVLGGALAGAAGGAALPFLAKGTLATGSALSPMFALRNVKEREKLVGVLGRSLRERDAQLRVAVENVRLATEAEEAIGREVVAAAGLDPAARSAAELAEAGAKQVRQRFEQRGFPEAFAAAELGADPATLRVGGGTTTLAEMERLTPEEAVRFEKASEQPALKADALSREEREFNELAFGSQPIGAHPRGRRSGAEILEEYRKQRAAMGPAEREYYARIYRDPTAEKTLLPGKIGQEFVLGNRQVFERELLEEFGNRTGLAHQPRIKAAKSFDELYEATLAEMASRLPHAKGLPIAQMRKLAREALETRQAAETLDELDRMFPGQFETTLGKIGLRQDQRFVAMKTLDDILSPVFTNDAWVRNSAKVPLAEAAAWKVLDWESKALLPFKKHRDQLEALLEGTGAMQGERVVMRGEIHDALFGKDGVVPRLFGREAPGQLRQLWRTMTRYWKGWTLNVFPAWITRNFANNLAMNFVSLGPGDSVIGGMAKGRALQKAAADFLRGEAVTGTLEIGGKTYKLAELAREAVLEGVLASGQAATDYGRRALDAIDAPKGWRAWLAADPSQSKLTKLGAGLNEMTEDWTRAAHFLARLGGGKSIAEAAASTRKWLGAFGGLETAEMQKLADFIPFARWLKHNVGVQMRSLVERPGATAFLGRLQANLDSRNRIDVPDEALPAWLQGQLTLPVSRGPDGKLRVFALQGWYGLADLAQIESPEKLFQFVVNQAHPLINEAVEQGLNFDTFTKRAIADAAGQEEHFLGFQIGKRSAHLLRNSRILNYFDRAIIPLTPLGKTTSQLFAEEIEQLTAGEAVAYTFGAKLHTTDLVKARDRRIASLKQLRGRYRSLVRDAQRAGDYAQANRYAAFERDADRRRQLLSGWDPLSHPGIYGMTDAA